VLIFGEKLKELRKEKCLTMKELSKKINASDAIICRWENNKAEPTAPSIVEIAAFFEVSTDYLLGLENDDGSKKRK